MTMTEQPAGRTENGHACCGHHDDGAARHGAEPPEPARERVNRRWNEVLQETRVTQTGVQILFGFLLQWPTLLTLLMFPFLLCMYGRLAVTEEQDMRERFGVEYQAYAARTPRFLPSWRKAALSP